jgi:hypothetical protein
MPPHAHDVNRRVKDNFDSLGFARAAIQHGTLGHNRFIQPFESGGYCHIEGCAKRRS